MSENTSLNLVQKLAKIREMVEVIRKNKSGYNYKYVTEDEILAKVAAGMKKYSVALHPSITPSTLSVTPIHFVKSKTTKSGDKLTEDINETLINADMVFTWINCDDISDRIDVPWVILGQQGDAAQAFGSALTYANRYFMMKFFQIATPDDDPDNWRSKKEEAEAEAEVAVTQSIITKIDACVTSFLNGSSDTDSARKILGDVVRKHVRNGTKATADYHNHLTDPNIAAILLDDIKKLPPQTAKKTPTKATTKTTENGGNE